MAWVKSVLLFFSALSPMALAPGAPQVAEHLGMLEPLVGLRCVGTLGGVEVLMDVEAILGGQAVRRTTTATALDYADETVMYWDIEEQRVAFLEVTSRGDIARGEVLPQPNGVRLRGRLITAQGAREFMNSLELVAQGTVKDEWYNLEAGEWTLGHSVECAPLS